MAEKMNIANVIQGQADVMIGGRIIGCVCQTSGTGIDAGWRAYDAAGRRVSVYPHSKRSHAAQALVASEISKRHAP